ncbi:MAG: type II toxin-antitoxin system Phd/YefM family antitoxin [Bacteroidota bacterium]
MFTTKGIDAIASVTELRSKTAELLDATKGRKQGVLVQRNNEPAAVLLSYERYMELIEMEAKRRKKKSK